MSYLEQLNESQYEAVTAPLGPVRVLAGAGSGKTRVLISRIAWLLETEQAEPFGILAVTFTNKAAFEMRTRLEDTLKFSLRGMWIGTFHSLCHRILRLHHRDAGLIENFQILDSDDQVRLCRRVIRARGLDEKLYQPRVLANFINGHKEEGRRAQHIEVYNDAFTKNLVQLYHDYQTLCEQSGLVDFSEILLRTVELLRTHQAILNHYQERFKFILVDEFQDTNSVQYAWLQLLSGKHHNLFVVGDDDQSIYGWRGAKVENILHFDTHFEGVTTVRLEQNYRSTKAILEAANHVIEKNDTRLEKRLWTDNESTQPIILYRGTDGYDEARFVVETIKERLKEGYQKSDIAILYRSNAQSRLFEELLLRGQIPYRVYGGLRFFDRAEIKDIMAYLRMVVNPNDDVSLERSMTTPPKGIGQATIEMIREYAAQQRISLWESMQHLLEGQQLTTRAHNVLLAYSEQIHDLMLKVDEMKLDQFFAYAIEQSGLKAQYKKEPLNRGEDRIDNLNELITAAEYFMMSDQVELAFSDDPVDIQSLTTREQLDAFMGQTSLDSSDAQAEAGEDSIQLMTLHASKGLEFPIVFLVGMEDGMFPSDASIQEADRLEEERRLAYVGITRAEKVLYLLGAEQRMIYGKTLRMPPSRFIRDIPSHLVEMIGPAIAIRQTLPSSKAGKREQFEDNIDGYKIGQFVSHPKFGDGVIQGFEGVGASTRVIVEFSESGRKVLVLSFANLKIL
ncbi:DNA helicase II [Ignatzschineria cameli]|uniref:DNA 3'-5' helicase n=1 Tax=Ignatzschineria cameli TaxID=2182793 RepID=A0ABX5L4N0_9GAMM|nr:DNA helicase II [Ignatzschineria cameli]PWD90477.1 DNA helicase II [Ignatzschineria cameli]PWD92361.1 DNA helicase II [Ignatzschineria cameli]PWD93154.1 DNA helicase II [Ignatzschineria cameli]